MSINILFLIASLIFLGAVIGLFVFIAKRGFYPVAFVAMVFCFIFFVTCMLQVFTARECLNCDRLVAGNYCEECGSQVRDNDFVAKNFCNNCGTQSSEEANFCGTCGVRMDRK